MAKANKGVAAAPITKKAEAKPATPVKVSAEKIKQAIEHAQVAHPHADFIYVNVKGEHHLHPRPGFVKVDVIDGEVITEAPAKVKAAKPVTEVEDDDLEAPNDGKEF